MIASRPVRRTGTSPVRRGPGRVGASVPPVPKWQPVILNTDPGSLFRGSRYTVIPDVLVLMAVVVCLSALSRARSIRPRRVVRVFAPALLAWVAVSYLFSLSGPPPRDRSWTAGVAVARSRCQHPGIDRVLVSTNPPGWGAIVPWLPTAVTAADGVARQPAGRRTHPVRDRPLVVGLGSRRRSRARGPGCDALLVLLDDRLVGTERRSGIRWHIPGAVGGKAGPATSSSARR